MNGLQTHFADRCMLLLLLQLLLLLTAREFVLTWSPAVFCLLTVLPPVTITMEIETAPKMSPCLAVCTKHFLLPRNRCFAERFGPWICHVFLS